MRGAIIAVLLCIAAASVDRTRAADVSGRSTRMNVDDQTGAPNLELLPPGKPVPTDSEAAGVRKPTGYRWHEGHWWYRLADGQWLMWTGDRWRSVPSLPPASSRRTWVEPRSYANLPPSLRPTNHGWVGGFYSSGGGYGASDFGYGYGIPTYGPYQRP